MSLGLCRFLIVAPVDCCFCFLPVEPEIDEKDETSDDSCVPLGLDWKMVDTDPLYPLIALVCSPAMGTAAAAAVVV